MSDSSTVHAHLERNLGLPEIFCIATGAMISSGLFILPGLAFAKVGPGVFISYFLGGLVALFGVLSISELCTAMPKAGGDYFFINRSLGPMVGTVSGLLSWFALSLKTAFAILGMAELAFVTLGWNPTATAMGVAVFFIALNIAGVKETVKVEVAVVTVMLVIIVGYLALGLPRVSVGRFEGLTASGINPILIGIGFVFVSYGGILKVASVSEEARRPGRDIPYGLLLSLGVVTVLYSLCVFVAVGTLQPSAMRGSLTPLADSAATFSGGWGRFALNIAAIMAFVSTVNAGIMAASRYPLALARDGLVPAAITAVSKRTGTPFVSILLTGAFILCSLLLELEILVKAASTVVLVSYILTHLSVIALRESKIQNFRPSFTSPFYPWVQILGIVFISALIFDMGEQAITVSLVLVASGLLFFGLYGRRATHRRYALLAVLGRITNRIFDSEGLEEELKGILSRRDDIALDRFDLLVEKGPVLDLEGPLEGPEFFAAAARSLAGPLDLEVSVIENLLIERERESSTVISPFVAIPHLVVPGENAFRIMSIRCREGIRLCMPPPSSGEPDSSDSPGSPDSRVSTGSTDEAKGCEKQKLPCPADSSRLCARDYSPESSCRGVKAVFVLAGSADERNFHLRALAAIAQVASSKSFEKRWMEARGPQGLLDLLHLSRRPRG